MMVSQCNVLLYLHCLVFTRMSVVAVDDKQEIHFESEACRASWFTPTVTTRLICQTKNIFCMTLSLVLRCDARRVGSLTCPLLT